MEAERERTAATREITDRSDVATVQPLRPSQAEGAGGGFAAMGQIDAVALLLERDIQEPKRREAGKEGDRRYGHPPRWNAFFLLSAPSEPTA
jgi:hypothetical protein